MHRNLCELTTVCSASATRKLKRVIPYWACFGDVTQPKYLSLSLYWVHGRLFFSIWSLGDLCLSKRLLESCPLSAFYRLREFQASFNTAWENRCPSVCPSPLQRRRARKDGNLRFARLFGGDLTCHLSGNMRKRDQFTCGLKNPSTVDIYPGLHKRTRSVGS